MKVLRYFFIFCIAVISSAVSAQDQKELFELMQSRGEYYFTVSVKNPAEAGIINRICSVDATDGKNVTCYANQKEYDEMIKAGYKPFLMMPPSMRETHNMWDGKSKEWDSYPTYSQYESMMQGFPSSIPTTVGRRFCTLLDLGTLNSGRKLLGVRINNGSPNGKPKFLYTSTMHGDETTGMILMLRLIDELCTSSDQRIANLVKNLDIFIFPNTNPDGTYYGGNNTVSGARRYNANGVDLNRHFPDFNNVAHPDNASSYQNEAQWMMDLAQEYLFTMSANFHGGAEVVNYPWDNTYDRHADDAWWQYVSTEYANKAHAVSSSYMTDENNGITNGADWYVITGSRQDYMNYYAQCREVTIECSSTKTPSASQLPNFWNYNHDAMLSYMEQCLNGVHGVVRDATSGATIQGVTVTVVNHDNNGSEVSTHEVGDFHRPIKGGTYTFRFEKPGYEPQDVDVTVADGQRVDLNIQLVRKEIDFTASSTTLIPGESINFTDATIGSTTWNWTFEGATPSTSTEQNPTNITYTMAGDYDVTLTITDSEGNSKTLTKSNYIHVEENINMQNGTITTCSGNFYDSGGPNSNYGDNLDYTLTIYPCCDGANVSVTFNEFSTESNYDFLYIYDGTSTSATKIGEYSGTTSPETVTATNDDGALTFRFTSDYSVNKSGWVASVTCVYPTITLANNGTGNSSTISNANEKHRNVKLSGRTLYKDGKWNTLCLPFTVDIADSPLNASGVEAKTLTDAYINGTTLYLTFGDAVNTLQAGVPYIIKWSNDTNSPTIFEPTFENVIVSNVTNDFDQGSGNQRVRFIGTKDQGTFQAEDRSILFLGENNTLYYPSSAVNIGACRAYFKIGEDGNSTRELKAFNINFGGNETTGIIEAKANSSLIYGEQSRTTLHSSLTEGWFTLDGRKLQTVPKSKGIYLNNGRVVVIK